MKVDRATATLPPVPNDVYGPTIREARKIRLPARGSRARRSGKVRIDVKAGAVRDVDDEVVRLALEMFRTLIPADNA